MQSESLPRSISYADLSTTDRCRAYIANDYQTISPEGGTNYFTSAPSFTLVVPALTGYDQGFKDFFYRRIVDQNTKDELERAKCLNYCREASELSPLFTSGDGNCLLHAASLCMWGFQDRTFILRKAISDSVMNCRSNSLKERWRVWREDELHLVGTVLESHQWEREWQDMVRYTTEAKNSFGVMEGLDQFHIFVLANVLRRPIIVFAAPKLRSAVTGGTLQQLDFHGLYLPLLWDPSNCRKGPLPIAFRNGHYSALTIIDNPQQYKNGFLLIPLFDSNGYDVPVRFLKQRVEQPWDCRKAYLDLTDVWHDGHKVHCAKLAIPDPPAYLKPLLNGFIEKCFQGYRRQPIGSPPLGQPGFAPCRTGCGRKGESFCNGYCFTCYEMSQQRNIQQNTSSTTPLRCTNNCNNPGHPDFLGMCQSCYQRQQKKTPPQGMGGASQEPVSRNCPTPGCEFYGSVETNYYCSSCFKKNMTQIYEQKEFDTTRRQSHPSTAPQYSQMYPPRDVPGGASGGQKCTVCWQSIGAPEYGGVCRQCYTSGSRASTRQICPQCREVLGSPDNGGLCSICFKKEAQKKASGDKCTECREFHGSPEYGGLCHGCFMQKTKSDQGQGRNQLDGPPWSQAQPYGSGSPQPRVAHSGSALDGKPIHPNVASQGHLPPSRQTSQTQSCIACNPSLPLDGLHFIVCLMHAKWIRSTLSVIRGDTPSQMSANPPVPIGIEPASADQYRKPIAPERPLYEATPKKTYQPSPSSRYSAPTLPPYQGTSSTGDRMPGVPSGSSAAMGYSGAASADEPKPAKMLCNVPGCSFLAEQRFNGLCQGCYDENYGDKSRSPYDYS